MPGSGEPEPPPRPNRDAWARLEDAVSRCLAEIREVRTRAEGAEERVRRMEALMDPAGGEVEPRRVFDRLHALEEENRELRDRLLEGREAVDRLLARIRFLEEHQ